MLLVKIVRGRHCAHAITKESSYFATDDYTPMRGRVYVVKGDKYVKLVNPKKFPRE